MTTAKPKVTTVPDLDAFANHLAIVFMEEQGINLESDENETPLEALQSVPEIHAEFSIWLCDAIRENMYGDIGSPSGMMLN